MRRACPDSAVVQFPFEQVSGYYQYPPALASEMEEYLLGLLTPHIPRERIFRWEEST